jgi:tetratricopeptide (TPR) repeat protein
MFRKLLVSLSFVSVILVVGNLTAAAQSAPVAGTVRLQKADGTAEPVAGALIEVYRTDIKAGFPSTKTNKKGEFVFAGMAFGATYTLAVSAPNCSPRIFPNVKAGDDKLVMLLQPGDGRKLLEDEVRKTASAVASGAQGTAPVATEDQKKQQAEYEAKVKEVASKNEKVQKANEIIAQMLKEGNEAFTAKNYDVAIAKYEQGIAADPNFVGTAPILSNNRGIVLLERAKETYNKAIRSTDPNEIIAGKLKARQDLTTAADGYVKTWQLLKTAPAEDVPDKAAYEAAKLGTLRGARDIFLVAAKTEQVDPATIEAAKVLIPEYTAAESDATKKAEASMIFADLYRAAGDSDNAAAAYKAILAASPDNPDALVGAGLSLVNLGYMNNDKAKLQEGADYLQKFVSVAPDTHKLKASAAESIKYLKEQNITPQKLPTGGTKKKGS